MDKIDLKSEVDDDRVESSILESRIIDIIKTCSFDEYKLFIPLSRWWFDVCLFKTKTDFIPINIKITTMKKADNSVGYSGLAFSLTTIEMNYDMNYSNTILSQMVFDDTNRDYWFLVIDKNALNDRVIINSIKGLRKITPNPNNLPFQIK